MRPDPPFDTRSTPMQRPDIDDIDYPAWRQRAIDLRAAEIASLRPRLTAFMNALSAPHSPVAPAVTPIPARQS